MTSANDLRVRSGRAYGSFRGGVERTIRDFWAGESARVPEVVLTVVTSPLSALFATGVLLRNLSYDHGLRRTASPLLPTISVGNLAVGGTGKTPVTRWLVDLLLADGESPAVVSRGFGEDELLLHRLWHPEVPVIQAVRRVEGVREAKEQGCTVAVVDDGFQHRAMERSLDIVLLSPAHPLPARTLPRGPFREPLRSLRRAHAVFVTVRNRKEREGAVELLEELRGLPGTPPARLLTFLPGAWRYLDGSPAPPPSGPLLALTSIAQPRGFVESVRDRHPGRDGLDLELLAYPDHHSYSPADLEAIEGRAEGRTVVTTEKDAVKLLPLVDGARADAGDFRVLPLEIAPGETVEEELRTLIDAVLMEERK